VWHGVVVLPKIPRHSQAIKLVKQNYQQAARWQRYEANKGMASTDVFPPYRKKTARRDLAKRPSALSVCRTKRFIAPGGGGEQNLDDGKNMELTWIPNALISPPIARPNVADIVYQYHFLSFSSDSYEAITSLTIIKMDNCCRWERCKCMANKFVRQLRITRCRRIVYVRYLNFQQFWSIRLDRGGTKNNLVSFVPVSYSFVYFLYKTVFCFRA